MEKVILVDEHDNEIGQADKLHAHQATLLHRAFSIFIYRQQAGATEYLLQKRHNAKYHSGGLWSNACCGHPRPGEELVAAACRRLKEEMGITAELSKLGIYVYKADVGHGLVEHEVDHIFIGKWQGEQISAAAEEVEDHCWLTAEQIAQKLKNQPESFTPWFAGAHIMMLSKSI